MYQWRVTLVPLLLSDIVVELRILVDAVSNRENRVWMCEAF